MFLHLSPRAARTKTALPPGARSPLTGRAFPQRSRSILNHPNIIEVVPGEVTEIPDGEVIIASGPLTSDALAAKSTQYAEMCSR